LSTHKLITALTGQLFEAEDRRLNGVIVRLNQENKQLTGSRIDGFLYLGQLYMPTGVNTTVADRHQAKTALHKSLIEPMERHLKDRKAVADERRIISQMLLTLLSPCRTAQDIRDTLPECLVNCVSGLVSQPRTREAAYTIQDNPRAMRQYEKLLPKMEVYSAARFLY
jgi:hypothetical protein